MKRSVRFFSACMIAIAVNASICFANNNLFLPGDAFFPTVLTKADVGTLQTAKTGKRLFEYSSLGGYDGAFCGYAGYLNAIVPAVDDAFAKNLEQVYQQIREDEGREFYERTVDGEAELVETNGIRVLLYPSEFKFPGHVLGLRYNENWVEECEKFGHKREHLRLCSLIPKLKAVERSWRDAKAVPGLNAQVPDVPLETVPVTTAPVVIQGRVKAIIIGSHSLEELFEKNHEAEFVVYVVDAKGITKMIYSEGEWSIRDGDDSPDD